MYVTRPLSHYLSSPESLSPSPEGPNSGYLVIQDEELETTTCFGLCKTRHPIDLPFPQNRNLTVVYSFSISPFLRIGIMQLSPTDRVKAILLDHISSFHFEIEFPASVPLIGYYNPKSLDWFCHCFHFADTVYSKMLQQQSMYAC
ncbi:uncharacterized protein LOC131309416 [Rhododendron vialii]|uniref:uncharacterized protein LOC131309416 n=1 Tax=Rhododendron vialii TaxID=182163 RepID=UPI00265E5388|nr:uncharacterized protein LOC131309416 [Rhododendron vialii]